MMKRIDVGPIIIESNILLPVADEGIRAGFPSPAQDYMDVAIDLNKELIKNPSTTFYGRVKGDSMIDADVYDGDILVIDKSIEPQDNDMAVCYLDGEFTLKYIEIHKDVIYLVPANSKYKKIVVTSDQNLIIWGIVTYVIHKARKRKR